MSQLKASLNTVEGTDKERDIEMEEKVQDDEMEEGEATDDDDIEVSVTIEESIPKSNKGSLLFPDARSFRPPGRRTPPYVRLYIYDIVNIVIITKFALIGLNFK